MSDMDTAKSFDLSSIDENFARDPFPTYRILRENDPVHRNPDGSYFLTRYADRPVLVLGTHFAGPTAGWFESHGSSWRFSVESPHD